MKSPSAPSASTLHVRNFRTRMREQGLVKKDVWIRPEHAQELHRIEQQMRKFGPDTTPQLPDAWTLDGIHHALAQTRAVNLGRILLERVEGAEPSLRLVMRDQGDLSVFLAVAGEQILVESFLWPASQVRDINAFHAHVLRLRKLLPLSSIVLQEVAGEASYSMYGALDAHSTLSSLMFEIETLADNVLSAADACAGFLAGDRDD